VLAVNYIFNVSYSGWMCEGLGDNVGRKIGDLSDLQRRQHLAAFAATENKKVV
jgi:hypothetical protein